MRQKNVFTILLVICVSFSATLGWGAESKQNIVLISLDTLRPDHLSFYGYERETSPNLSRLAEEGLVFKEAYSTSSWTLPAHASVFTGLYPWQHGLTKPEFRLRDDVPTIAEDLSSSGYECVAFVSGYTLHSGFGFSRGFEIYDDFSAQALGNINFGVPKQAPDGPKESVTSPIITRLAVKWLENRSDERPFFLFLHYFDIHDHYIPPKPFDALFDPDYTGPVDGRIENQHTPKSYSPRDLEHLRALYDGEIAWVDQQLGMVLAELEQLGLRKNTTLIIFSDHGEGFGEHGMFRHGNSLYEELVKALIMFVSPIVDARGESTLPVSVTQIYQTIRQFSGLPSRQSRPPSLVNFESGEIQSGVTTGSLNLTGSSYFLREDSWKLIVDDSQPMLFNLDTDPLEQNDQSKQERERMSGIMKAFREMISDEHSSTASPGKSAISEETLSKIRALGYF